MKSINRYGNAIRDRAFMQGYRGGWNDALDEAREDLRRKRRL